MQANRTRVMALGTVSMRSRPCSSAVFAAIGPSPPAGQLSFDGQRGQHRVDGVGAGVPLVAAGDPLPRLLNRVDAQIGRTELLRQVFGNRCFSRGRQPAKDDQHRRVA